MWISTLGTGWSDSRTVRVAIEGPALEQVPDVLLDTDESTEAFEVEGVCSRAVDGHHAPSQIDVDGDGRTGRAHASDLVRDAR